MNYPEKRYKFGNIETYEYSTIYWQVIASIRHGPVPRETITYVQIGTVNGDLVLYNDLGDNAYSPKTWVIF